MTGEHGIVRRCRQLPRSDRLPSVPVCVATGPRRGFNGWSPATEVVGMGVAEDPSEARVKAIAEAVERYCFAYPPDPSLVLRAPYREISDWAVPTSRFAQFSAEQCRANPSLQLPGPDEPLDWTWAYSLTRQAFALVPAALAYASIGNAPPNRFTRWVMSTGVATHTSVEAATLAGLFEVIERDAIMVHWLTGHCPPRVHVDAGDCPGLAHLIDTHFQVDGVEFTLLALSTDLGVPTVACLAHSDRDDRPSVFMGAATRSDAAEACRKSLFETAQLLTALHNLGWLATSEFPAADVRTLWDHAHFYAGAHSRPQVEFLLSSSERLDVSAVGTALTGDAASQLRQCVDRLAAAGLEALVVDLTPADVARVGLRTVKVLVPGAVDINGDVRFPPLGSPRLRDVPEKLGWPSPQAFNRAPCPMT